MRQIAILIVVLGIMPGLTQAQSPRKTTLAVMDLNVTGISKADGVLLTDALLSYLVNTDYYDIVERSKRDEILKEQGFAQSGACTETACLIEVGKYLAVQKMIGGSIGKLGETWMVNVRLLDVRTGKIEKACIKNYVGKIDQLLNYMDIITQEIVRATGSTKIELEAIRQKEVADTVTAIQSRIETNRQSEVADSVAIIRGRVEAARQNNSLDGSTVSNLQWSERSTENIINSRDGSILIEIPAGPFTMGSNDYDNEKPSHYVNLDKYYIGKYEVTAGQFKKYCNAIGKKMPKQPEWNIKDDQPVVNVTWKDAKAYCDWAGLRLPTEAEWEKAAKGTDDRTYPWGNSWEGNKCNHGLSSSPYTDASDGYEHSSLIGRFQSGVSPYGIHDMAGNVWEWCNDWYGYYSSSTPNNPSGPSSGSCRVVRGGSWFVGANRCRSTYRSDYVPASWFSNIGFRVAK